MFGDNQIFNICKNAQKDAISDKLQVGSVVVGINKNGLIKHFSGANLHISDSFADIHAEQLALNLCLLERCYPLKVYATSKSETESVILCGTCRHYFSEVNQDIEIIIFNPDGRIKNQTRLNLIYPARKDLTEKNNKFKKLCGFKKL